MNRDNPTLRWLAWPVCLVLVVPFLGGMLFHDVYGIFAVLFQDRVTNHWPWLLILAGYSLPLVALLRWKRLVAALTAMTLLGYSQMICLSFLPETPKEVRVEFGDHHHESGVDVFCNDVKLGTTPFVMTAAEFHAKVKPWTQPPEQPVVYFHSKQDGTPLEKDFRWWQWTWTPGDPFPWPQDFQIYQKFNDQTRLLDYCKTAPYWFRFEKDGCLTLRTMNQFSGGGGGGRIIKLQVNLGLHIPAKDRMSDLVLSGLRALEYRPSREWTAFVLKYRDELMDQLVKEAETDKRLLEVLDRLADDHFELPPGADLQTSRAALQRILESVSRSEEQDFRWFAGRTALRIVKTYPQLLVESVRKEMSASRGAAATFFWTTGGRRDLLLDLAAEVPAPELFDLYVYQQGLGAQVWYGGEGETRLMIAIGNSGRPEAIPLLHKYLDDIWDSRDEGQRFLHDQKREGSVRVMTKVFPPDLEDKFWYLVSQKIKPDHFNKYGPLPKFIQSRIDKGGDLQQLIHRIVSCESLSEDQKGPLLAQINHPAAGVWLAVAGDRLGDYKRDELMDEICRLPPNPALAKFLVATWERKHKLQPGSIHPHWNLAILQIDTPEVREFIRERLTSEDPPNQYKQWSNFTSISDTVVPGSLAHHNWLVPELRKTTDYRRSGSLELLMVIGTPEARALLQEWADDPKSGVSQNAKGILKRPAEQEARRSQKNAENLAKVNDLLTGRIKPDNLLRPYPSAHWTGQTYEPTIIPRPDE